MTTNELFPQATTNLPEKWFVKRNVENCKIVNEIFSKLNNRKYSDNGFSRYIYRGEVVTTEQDYMHYPRIENTGGKKCVYSRPQKGYKEISVEQLKRFIMGKEITKDNWYIRGGSELTELLSDKTINDTNVQGLSIGLGYVIRKNTTRHWESWSMSWYKANGKKEITVAEFKEFVLPLLKKEEPLPEKWYISGSNDLCSYLKHCPDNKSILAGNDKYNAYYKNEADIWTWYPSSLIAEDYVEITYEQFWNSLQKNKKDMSKLELPPQSKLIGYKLTATEYNKAALAICQTNSWELNKKISVSPNSLAATALRQADVLDKWFEPVYETVPQLPIIESYDGVIVGDNIKYGCALLPIAWFKKSENRQIYSFTTSNKILIRKHDMDEIRKYLKHHGFID